MKEQADAGGFLSSLEGRSAERAARDELQEPFKRRPLRSHDGTGCRYVENACQTGTCCDCFHCGHRVPLALFDVETMITDEMDVQPNQSDYLNFRPGKRRSDKPLSEMLRSQVFARSIFCIGVIYECSGKCSGLSSHITRRIYLSFQAHRRAGAFAQGDSRLCSARGF